MPGRNGANIGEWKPERNGSSWPRIWRSRARPAATSIWAAGTAHDRLVRAVVVRHHGVGEAVDQLGGRVGAAAEGEEHDVGHLDRAGLHAVDEGVEHLVGEDAGRHLAAPLPEAVAGDGVGPQARGRRAPRGGTGPRR